MGVGAGVLVKCVVVEGRDPGLTVVKIAHTVVIPLLPGHSLKKQVLPCVLLDLLQQQIVSGGHVVVFVLLDRGYDRFFGVFVQELKELFLHFFDNGNGVCAYNDAFQLYILDLLVPFMLADIIQFEPRLGISLQ